MTADGSDELDRAAAAARRWLESVGERAIPPRHDADTVRSALPELADGSRDPADVVARLVDAVEPGLMAIGSGRFFGWVMGGTLPAALAADWLVSAWDQNAGMRDATPGVVAVEEAAAHALIELLGLPAEAAVGFVTGATMANFSCLAAARSAVLMRAGWDVARDGLQGAPRVRVIAGAERHGSIDLALRYLGLGLPETVAVDAEGRMDPAALRRAIAAGEGPLIVCGQAGNIHSGAFDPFGPIADAVAGAGGWLHVDGAFGLWAAVSPALADLVSGMDRADSWASDAHKTLNTPYDGGIAIVRDPVAMADALAIHASYLLGGTADPLERVPEMSRRARGVPIWAALLSLGRDGVRGLVDGMVAAARGIAEGAAGIDGVEVLNDVVFTQVCVALGDDERTRRVADLLVAEGEVLPSPSRWRDRAVIRFSVSDWRTDAADVRRTVAAVERAVAAIR
jgi:glutamate/tyrosine decarboxylase-like PLP-dependent enzyme